MPIVYGGPVNIITLASTQKDYMWAVSSCKVSYIYTGDGGLTEIARYEALEDATGGLVKSVPGENFKAFALDSAAGMSKEAMNSTLVELLGENYPLMFGNGMYPLWMMKMSYSNFGSNLYAFTLTDPERSSCWYYSQIHGKGHHHCHTRGDHPPKVRLFGLAMTYDSALSSHSAMVSLS